MDELDMDVNLENYYIAQLLSGKKIKHMVNNKTEYLLLHLPAALLVHSKQFIVISDNWFSMHVYTNAVPKIYKMLKNSGVAEGDISKIRDSYYTKIYVTQKPDIFIPCLMKFEELSKKYIFEV